MTENCPDACESPPWMQLVTNFEVLQLLLEELKSRPHPRAAPPHVLKMNAQFLRYLTSHCAPTCKQKKSSLKKLLAGLNGFALTKAEKLQIINLLPRSLVELHLILEECEERFSEEDMVAILKVVKACRPVIDDGDAEEEGGPPATSGEEETTAQPSSAAPTTAEPKKADIKKRAATSAGAKKPPAAMQRKVIVDDDDEEEPGGGRGVSNASAAEAEVTSEDVGEEADAHEGEGEQEFVDEQRGPVEEDAGDDDGGGGKGDDDGDGGGGD